MVFLAVWSLLAIGVSVLSEGWYYKWRAMNGSKLRWSSLVWGNLFSSVVLLTLPYAALEIKETKPALVSQLQPYQKGLFWGSVISSGLVFALS